ncbi:MAG: hypothetical protein ACREEB_07165 [Caulobacteraceae bacterium]
MKLLLSASVAAAIAAFALPAAASPAFDAFRKVCGDSHADFAAIKAALAGPGWTSADVHPTNMEGVTPDESIARATTAGGQRVTVDAWIGKKGAYNITACTAKVVGGAPADLAREAQAWLGFAPASVDSGKSTWRYGVTGGKPAAVDKAGFNAAAAGTGLFFFNLFPETGDVVLDMLKIKS